ncbi:MAG: glycosyltransferase family 4 protein [Bacteroidales bacterium]|nr:glycosyltransferase family 4 protein [Bacteroidales bacterium]
MKKVLIISYYWPPGGGAGVFRWLKFTKYLRDYGWEPVIYTPENPETPVTDPSLSAQVPPGVCVLKHPIWEPYHLYKLFSGRKRTDKVQTGFLQEKQHAGFADKAAAWIRGNFFIPDARRFWIRPSIKYLSAWLSQNRVDALVSTGPPHSMHLIALGLKKRHGLPWLADFRDPWTQIDFYDKLMLTGMADSIHKKLEKKVLKHADKVVSISRNCAKDLELIGGRTVEVITNGYDPEDFDELPGFSKEAFSICHLGAMNADRNPEVLWKALSALMSENQSFRDKVKLLFIGKVDVSVRNSLKEYGLDPVARFIEHSPHREALAKASCSAILLLALNRTPNVLGIAPGKLYEYLALNRPVLCIGPDEGDAAEILRETQSGTSVGFDDTEKCKQTLAAFYDRFTSGRLTASTRSTGRYSRKALTGQMAGLLNDIASA